MLTMIFFYFFNVFMSRSRLYGDDREAMLGNVLDNLNGLMQFTQSQKLGQIERSYYLGISDEDIQYMISHNPHETIKISTTSIYDGKGIAPPPEAHFCCFNMLLGKNNFDLISARVELNKYIKSKVPKKTWLLILIGVIVALSIPVVILIIQVRSVENNISRVNAFINSHEVVHRLAEIDRLQSDITMLNNIMSQAEMLYEWERTLPVANSHILDAIIFNHNVDIIVTNITFIDTTGVIRVTATCTRSTAPNDYVNALLANAFVSDVNYLGFSGTDGETFTFSVDIFLNAEGVR
jgi:hypothetical protein